MQCIIVTTTPQNYFFGSFDRLQGESVITPHQNGEAPAMLRYTDNSILRSGAHRNVTFT